MHTLLKSARRCRAIPRALIIVLATWTGQSFAIDSFDNFQVHGFVNQGVFLSSDNNVYGDSSDHHGSLELTEIGLNASARPFNNIGLAIQGIYRHAGQISDEARIDYALIDWTVIEHDNYQMGIRLGRIKNPLGLFNETRDVAFTRPSITLPGIYQERSRNLFLNSDGGQLYLSTMTKFGDFSLQINAGKLGNDVKEVEMTIFNFDAPGKLEPKPAYMGRLEFESINGFTHLAISYANVEMDYKPGAVAILPAGDLSFELLVFSAQQHFGNVTLTGEYLRTHNSITNFSPVLTDFKPTSESYYIQGDYRFNPHFQGMVRYDASYNNIEDRNGEDFAALTGNPNYAAYTKDYMLGLRWTPHRNWMIQVEYHRIDGVNKLSFADNPIRSATKQHWNLLALQISYRF